MAGEASSSHVIPFLSVDEAYFAALYEEETIFPISDENYAQQLQLQEAIFSSFISSSSTMVNRSGKAPAPTKKLKAAQSSRSSTLCMICMDTKRSDDMFRSNSCWHSFCEDCISKYLAVKIQDNIASVKCPDPKCEALLEPQLCSSFVPKQVLERWADALCEAMILGTLRTYCPFKDCSAVMIEEGGSEAVKATECPECRLMFCARCNVGWHAEMECQEFQKLLKSEGERDDIMTMRLAQTKNWRRCPNCKILVEKISGCLHITCRCGFEFCYGCGAKWSGSHACPTANMQTESL